jgi:F420-dependent methylenetetrahydromethanopterin dehydrogenase
MHRVREAFRLGVRATLESDLSFFLGAREKFRAPFFLAVFPPSQLRALARAGAIVTVQPALNEATWYVYVR